MIDYGELERAAREDLKHHPMFLLRYAELDGPDPTDTDCRFMSLGWAQYNQRDASLKILRHTGDRWSRQSEELPLHRVIDGTILLVEAMRSLDRDGHEYHLNDIKVDADTFSNQDRELYITAGHESPDAFARQLTAPTLLGRLATLRRKLNRLFESGLIK